MHRFLGLSRPPTIAVSPVRQRPGFENDAETTRGKGYPVCPEGSGVLPDRKVFMGSIGSSLPEVIVRSPSSSDTIVTRLAASGLFPGSLRRSNSALPASSQTH